MNLSNIKKKYFGNAENRSLGCWVRTKCAPSLLCSVMMEKLIYKVYQEYFFYVPSAIEAILVRLALVFVLAAVAEVVLVAHALV